MSKTKKTFTVTLDLAKDEHMTLMRDLLLAGATMEDAKNGGSKRVKPGGRGKGEHFRHPSGKTLGELLLEYLKANKTSSRASLEKFAAKEGFQPTSVGPALSDLKARKKISVVDDLVDLK